MDIVLPTYELLTSVIDSMESVTLDIHSAKGQKNYKWHEKKDTAVFRGRDSCQVFLLSLQTKKNIDECCLTGSLILLISLFVKNIICFLVTPRSGGIIKALSRCTRCRNNSVLLLQPVSAYADSRNNVVS